MRKSFAFIGIAVILFMIISSCNKTVSEHETDKYGCVKGKLLRETCQGAVIQILTPGLNIGDATWEDRHGSLLNPVDAVYNNVVNAANICSIREDFSTKNIFVGDTIFFDLEIVENSYFDNDCIICAAFEFDMPVKKAVINNLSKGKCFEEK